MSGDTGTLQDSRQEHLGIPKADFLEDVDTYMREQGPEAAEGVLRHYDEMHNKYHFMETNLQAKKGKLKAQIPDIKMTLNIVKHQKTKQDSTEATETRFMLSDQLYAKARIPPTDKVCLWLGANVMLEYPIDEAEELLQRNLNAAAKNLEELEGDIGFLKDQTTTVEVNMARVYNWDVKRREAAMQATS